MVERGPMQGVFLLDQNKIATLGYVTLGKPAQGQVEVPAGLQEGDWLVARPATAPAQEPPVHMLGRRALSPGNLQFAPE